MEKNFHISQPQFQTILAALSELPFKVSAPIIQSLQEQAMKLDADKKSTEPPTSAPS